MYNTLGVLCQNKFFQALDDSPFEDKPQKIDIKIGIIEGFTWDLFGDGSGMVIPIFDKIYQDKNSKNFCRPFILIGNLFIDWDPALALCIPKKCTGNMNDLFGNLFTVGKIEVQNKRRSDSLLEIVKFIC